MSRAPHRRSVGLRPPTRCESLTEIPHRLSAYHPVALALDRAYSAHSFSLHLRQIDPIFAKLRRPLCKQASALGAFLGRRSGIDNIFDRLCGELLSTQHPAGLA